MKTNKTLKNIKKYIVLINYIFEQEIKNNLLNIILLHILKSNKLVIYIIKIYIIFLDILSLIIYNKHLYNLDLSLANNLRKKIHFIDFLILKIDNFFGVVSSLHIYGHEKLTKIKNVNNKSNQIFFPFIVIGSGPSGSVTASKISKQFPSQVALLERGKFFSISKTKHPGSEFMNKWDKGGINSTFFKERISFASGNCVGGGSEINSGLFHEPDSIFLKKWIKDFKTLDLTMKSLKPFLDEVKTLVNRDLSKQSRKYNKYFTKGVKENNLDYVNIKRFMTADKNQKKNTMSNVYLKE